MQVTRLVAQFRSSPRCLPGAVVSLSKPFLPRCVLLWPQERSVRGSRSFQQDLCSLSLLAPWQHQSRLRGSRLCVCRCFCFSNTYIVQDISRMVVGVKENIFSGPACFRCAGPSMVSAGKDELPHRLQSQAPCRSR